MKNYLKVFLLLGAVSFFSCFASLTFATEGSNNADLLEQAFKPAVEMNTVFGGEDAIWRDGSYILKGRTEATLFGKDRGVKSKASLLVQITQALLTATIVLSITMLIYNGILYMVKSSKGENPKEVINNIIRIAGGILLALLSIMIVKFASSIGATTIGLQ